jgi:hypothetical protein
MNAVEDKHVVLDLIFKYESDAFEKRCFSWRCPASLLPTQMPGCLWFLKRIITTAYAQQAPIESLLHEQEIFTEADIRTVYHTGNRRRERNQVNVMTQLREEIYYQGPRHRSRKTVRRGGQKADYIYSTPNIPIAVVKQRTTTTRSAGMQQALEYAETRRHLPTVPTAMRSLSTTVPALVAWSNEKFLTNFLLMNSGALPSGKGYSAAQETVTTQDYYDDGSARLRVTISLSPSTTVDAIARGENRILL